MNQRVPSGTSESVHPLTPPSFFFLFGTYSITQFLTSNMICIVVTGQTHRQTHRQTDGQWEGQTEGGKDRQTYINIYIHSLYFLFNHRVSIKNELISLRNKTLTTTKNSQKCIYLQDLNYDSTSLFHWEKVSRLCESLFQSERHGFKLCQA